MQEVLLGFNAPQTVVDFLTVNSLTGDPHSPG